MSIMQHVVNVESSGNPYAIGVVNGRLSRQPRNLSEALATVQMLEAKGFNFSIGIAQVNRYNLKSYGLNSYEQAFQVCPNLKAGTRILKECYDRSKHWGKAFSCYYSGNFVTGYKHGYVQKITASMQRGNVAQKTNAISVVDNRKKTTLPKQSNTYQITSNTAQTISRVEKVDYSRLTNKTGSGSRQHTTPVNNEKSITNTTHVAPVRAPIQPNLLPNESSKINRKVGVAEITPKVYTDNAFVF